MESIFAHIEDEVVVSTEVVSSEFIKQNPERYSGLWIQIGEGTKHTNCGIGFIYSKEGDYFYQQQEEEKQEGTNVWSEKKQTWIYTKIK